MTTLKFIDVPVRSKDPVVRAREALNLRLAEQIARAKDPALTRERRKGKGKDRTTVSVPVPAWFTTRADGRVVLTVKAGGKKCTAIEIPSIGEFEDHVILLMKAVAAGNLDQFLGKKLVQRKAPAKAAPAPKTGIRRAA